jgi:hypothetical protein
MAFLLNFHSALLRSPHHPPRPQSSNDRSAHAPSLGGTTSNGGWCPRPTTSCPLDSCDSTSVAMSCCCSGLRPSTAALVFGQSAVGAMRSTKAPIRVARVGLKRTCDYIIDNSRAVNKNSFCSVRLDHMVECCKACCCCKNPLCRATLLVAVGPSAAKLASANGLKSDSEYADSADKGCCSYPQHSQPDSHLQYL